MKKIKYLVCILLPAMLLSCDLFLTPPNEVTEIILHPYLDGYISNSGTPVGFDSSSPAMIIGSSPDITYVLMKFPENEIPVGSQILSANLMLRTNNIIFQAGEVGLHRIRRSWDHKLVTWEDVDQPDAFYDNEPMFSEYIERPADWYGWDIRELVQDWANGADNNGVLLKEFGSAGTIDLEFVTTEGGNPPELHIRYY